MKIIKFQLSSAPGKLCERIKPSLPMKDKEQSNKQTYSKDREHLLLEHFNEVHWNGVTL